MGKNTVKIKITKIEYSRNAKLFCTNVLGLRKAYQIGDEETINHTVLGRLKSQQGSMFNFEIINPSK